MKISVFHDLFDVMIHQFRPNFIQIIPIFKQVFLIINGKSINIFHYQNMRRRVLTIEPWRLHEYNFLILFRELLHIGRLRKEIHLFLRDHPQLVQHHIQIHHIFQRCRRHQLHCFVQKADISCHDLVDSLTLDLHDHLLAAF